MKIEWFSSAKPVPLVPMVSEKFEFTGMTVAPIFSSITVATLVCLLPVVSIILNSNRVTKCNLIPKMVELGAANIFYG